MSLDIINGDRRADCRYLVELPLSCCYGTDRAQLKVLSGVSVEISRRSLRFTTEDPVPVGAMAEVRIQWPFLLQGVCPLELVLTGPVIRSSSNGLVQQILRHEFVTCGARSFSVSQEKDGASRVA
jgi:hypothetical protein